MKKIVTLVLTLFGIAGFCFAADVSVVIEISNVAINEGKLIGEAFYSEAAYKNKIPDISFQADSTGKIVIKEVKLPEGDCVIRVFQDRNENGILDHGLFPKEPVGMTNYNGGIPANFDKLKVKISNNSEKIIIKLIKFL